MELRIKKDVDLKELEKFGFEKRYDEHTGEVKLYKRTYQHYRKIGWKKEWFTTDVNIYVKDRVLLDDEEEVNYRGNNYRVVYVEFMFTIFDLIQAGLVEKVVEDERR